MRRVSTYSFCLLLTTLLIFAAGCAKSPEVVMQPKPTEQQAQPEVVVPPEPVQKPAQIAPEPTEQQAQPQLPVKRGDLVVMSEPIGAEVHIDGKPMGNATLALKDVPAGSYRVRVWLNEDYEEWRGNVDVKHQGLAEVRAKLKPKDVALEVRCEPDDAAVKIDGEDAGVAPYSKWVSAGGEHSITVSAEGYYPETRKVTIPPGGKETISVALREIPKGTLEVRSQPNGAKVWLDGKDAGTTPYSGSVVADEEHTIFVYAKGYRSQSREVTVSTDGREVVSVALEELKAGEDENVIINDADGAEMVLIPAGEFLMGSPEGGGDDDEHPQHTVFVDAFYMDKYEVTNAQYKQFMDATGHRAPGYWGDEKYNQPDRPVVGVSWHDAKAYCQWAGKRLPTEAEWEKAARGGLVGKKYPGGDTLFHNDANYSGTGGKDTWSETAPVGSFAPNGYGLYDMAGNVWEWCADWFGSGYYANSPAQNPVGPDSGSFRVLRGGSWLSVAYGLRAANRGDFDPSNSYYGSGFRGVVAQD